MKKNQSKRPAAVQCLQQYMSRIMVTFQKATDQSPAGIASPKHITYGNGRQLRVIGNLTVSFISN